MNRIVSLQNPEVKRLVKLRENPDFREQERSVLITGFKLIGELTERFTPKQIYAQSPYKNLPTTLVSSEVMKKITALNSPEPIAAEFPLPPSSDLNPLSFVLVLDRINDPGNMGTLIRTALALGWEGLFLLPGCVDPFHDKVVRASRAALFTLPWKKGSWEELLALKSENSLFVADMEGTPLPELQSPKSAFLLLSNEARGASLKAKQQGQSVCIPIQNEMESLNVAIAGALLMYHLRKKR